MRRISWRCETGRTRRTRRTKADQANQQTDEPTNRRSLTDCPDNFSNASARSRNFRQHRRNRVVTQLLHPLDGRPDSEPRGIELVVDLLPLQRQLETVAPVSSRTA